MEDEPKYKSKTFEIVPNTKRNQELRAKKLAEENQKKQEDEKVTIFAHYYNFHFSQCFGSYFFSML